MKKKRSSDFYLHHILQCILLGLHMRTRLAHTHRYTVCHSIAGTRPSLDSGVLSVYCRVVGVWWRTKDMETNETQTNKNNNTFNYRSSGERRVVKWRTHTQLSLNIHLVVDAFVRSIFFFYSCLFVFLILTYARRLCARPDTIGVSFFLVFFLFFLFRECCASNAELLLYPSTIQKRPSNSVTIIIIISIRNKICFVISLVLANNIFCCCCCCVGFLFVDFDGVARFRPKWAFWSMALNDDAASTDSLQFIFIVCA